MRVDRLEQIMKHLSGDVIDSINIDEMTLLEKFEIIKNNTLATPDYKNKAWLEHIYEHNLNDIADVTIHNSKNSSMVIISDNTKCVSYISRIENGGVMQDAMLNALVKFYL